MHFSSRKIPVLHPTPGWVGAHPSAKARETLLAARDAFKTAAMLKPSLANAFHGWGTICLELNDPVGALAPLQQAVALDKHNLYSWNNLLLAALQCGHRRCARLAYRTLMRTRATDTETILLQSLAAYNQGDSVRAHALFKRACEQNADVPTAYQPLALALEALPRTDSPFNTRVKKLVSSINALQDNSIFSDFDETPAAKRRWLPPLIVSASAVAGVVLVLRMGQEPATHSASQSSFQNNDSSATLSSLPHSQKRLPEVSEVWIQTGEYILGTPFSLWQNLAPLHLASGIYASLQEPSDADQENLSSSVLSTLEADLAPLVGDEAFILENHERLNPEFRAHLAYLYARLNRPQLADPLATASLEQTPNDKRLLTVMASMYLNLRDAHNTLRYAREILRHYPGDSDGLFFLATGHQLANQPAEARHILYSVKRAHTSHAPYPFELDLASAANQSGDWHLAMLSYITILREHTLTPELRQQVRFSLDRLYRAHNPQLEIRFQNLDAGVGQSLRYEANYSAPITQRARVHFQLAHTDEQLTASTEFFEHSRKALNARFKLDYTLSRILDSEFWLSRFDNRLGFGTRFTVKRNNGNRYGFSYDHARPAEDSQALRFLQGRERRATLEGEFALPLGTRLTANLYGREIFVNDSRLGKGWGADWQLTYPFNIYSLQNFLFYRGAHSEFSTDTRPLSILNSLPLRPTANRTVTALEGLVSDRVHREGAGILLTRNFEDTWIVELSAGADYFVYLAQTAWDVRARILYRPRKSVELWSSWGYSNSDASGNQNAENTQIEFGLRKIF